MLFFFHHYELPAILNQIHQMDPDGDLLADPIAALTDEIHLPALLENNLPNAEPDQQQVHVQSFYTAQGSNGFLTYPKNLCGGGGRDHSDLP